jgi:hypothetical protein
MRIHGCPRCAFDWRVQRGQELSLAMKVGFENPIQKIGAETLKTTEFLLDVIILTLLFRARKELSCYLLKSRKEKRRMSL